MDYNMLNYILRDTNFNLLIYIQEVLEDSLNNPDHSAVYVSNLIKCYINIMTHVGNKLPYKDVKGYMLYNNFEEEYNIFEKNRKKESEYYKDEQF